MEETLMLLEVTNFYQWGGNWERRIEGNGGRNLLTLMPENLLPCGGWRTTHCNRTSDWQWQWGWGWGWGWDSLRENIITHQACNWSYGVASRVVHGSGTWNFGSVKWWTVSKPKYFGYPNLVTWKFRFRFLVTKFFLNFFPILTNNFVVSII